MGKRILIADDFDGTAETLAEIIESTTCCTAVAVKDGAEAVEQALLQRPDIALLDIDMPVLCWRRPRIDPLMKVVLISK